MRPLALRRSSSKIDRGSCVKLSHRLARLGLQLESGPWERSWAFWYTTSSDIEHYGLLTCRIKGDCLRLYRQFVRKVLHKKIVMALFTRGLTNVARLGVNTRIGAAVALYHKNVR